MMHIWKILAAFECKNLIDLIKTCSAAMGKAVNLVYNSWFTRFTIRWG